MAILLRSVKRNGAPITAALDAAGIPYVVTGMTDLFQAKEAHAARQLFYFMASRTGVDAEALTRVWRAAGLGLETRALRRAVANAADSRTVVEEDTDEGARRRWGGVLSPTSVSHVPRRRRRPRGARAERTRRSRLLQPREVQPDHHRLRDHSLPLEAGPEVRRVSPASCCTARRDAYPEGWQDNQYANPDAVRIMTVHQAKGMEWPVVFFACAPPEPVSPHPRSAAGPPGTSSRETASTDNRASKGRSRTSAGSSTSR